MSGTTPEFAELIRVKLKLESDIQAIIDEFECRYGHAINISNIDLLRMRQVGGKSKAAIKISLEIA
jgi:hypothetical protein